VYRFDFDALSAFRWCQRMLRTLTWNTLEYARKIHKIEQTYVWQVRSNFVWNYHEFSAAGGFIYLYAPDYTG